MSGGLSGRRLFPRILDQRAVDAIPPNQMSEACDGLQGLTRGVGRLARTINPQTKPGVPSCGLGKKEYPASAFIPAIVERGRRWRVNPLATTPLGLFFGRRAVLRRILARLLARIHFLLLNSVLLFQLLGLLRVALLGLLFLSLADVWPSHLLVLLFLLLLKLLMFLILFGR